MAPCPPSVTSKQYNCGTNTAVFTWTDPAGSLSFSGQLAGEGYQDSCQTANTSCVFQNIPCDLDFNVTVQAQGAHCTSVASVSESLKTVPCAPQNVSATLGCFNHSALVTWLGSPSAVGYNVTATAQDGHTHHCHSNTTMCQIPDIHCGETYFIKVTPFSETCTGDHSATLSFSAGLCAPSNVTASPACEDGTVSWSLVAALCPSTNLTGQVDCDTNTVTLMWDPSPESGATYTLQTERIGGTLPPTAHTTSNTSHTFTNLLCGQRYAFRIAAQDGNCRSSDNPPIEISTAPCQPTNFSARVDCGTNNGNFSWVESIGAGFYTVEVTGEHGHVASCSSNDTSCAVKLHCGRSYSATLVASTESCNSTKHADIHFESAPCLPGDVVADINCNTNVMNVSWAQTMGSDDYTALAISMDGHNMSCNSTSNSCSIHNLQCGKVYDVVVTSSSIHCSIIAGSDYKVQSAPCKPENTTVDQNCSSNVMTVKWDQSGRHQNHTVTASSASGINSTCDSTESSCSFLDLSCGQPYTFTVMGHTNVCMSEISTPIEKNTAPCPPTNVSAELNCTTHKALVSWSSAAAATAYSIEANSTNGHFSSCSDMGTSCDLDNLVCGQQYSVVVEAMHTGCPGPASPPAMLTTEPCAPTNLSIHYNVSTAQVMWAAASGASSYSVEAVTDQGSMITCNTTNNGCSLNGLQCGQIYNVTATAHNQACKSLTSVIHHLITEPCPPSNVQVSVPCEQLTATVSWDRSNLAVGYIAYLDNQNGQYTSCVAIDTHCNVSGLACGTEYNVRVKALGQQYNSSDSTVVSSKSGPCKPSSIEAIMDCQVSSATVSWQPSVGALSYTVELTASSGHTSRCTTNHTNCQLSPLQCGEEYNVSVTALGEGCNSTAQMAGHLTTEPCVPTHLSVHYNLSRAQVTWAASSGASSYSVEAVTDQGSMIICNSTNNSCSLNGLQCGQIYNVTVLSHNQDCNNTVTSAPERFMTEPCPPSNVQANVVCEQLTSTVSWEQSDLAVGYIAYLDNQNGHYTSCFTTGTQCTASGLTCGTVYNVWVKALGQQYNSSDSTVVTLTSAPCLPGAVEVQVNCNSDGAAVVSWNTTYGAANFSLTAPVSGRLQTLCTTQQNSCNVTNLTCGETYNLSLTVSNEQCSLTTAMPANLTTRPCPPQRVDVNLQCGSGSTVLSWEEDSDVDLYTATAIKASGGEVKKCNSTGSTCHFNSLACGETYNFSVTAHSQGCCSQASGTVSIQTEPCQPVITSAQVLCQSDQVQISWHQASGVMNYLVTAMGSLGYVDAYNTTQTLLSATLPCGQDYNVTVQGQGRECDTVRSSPAFFKTSPCVPQDLMTYVQCESNMGSVSWGPSDGAESYVAVATGLDGHNHQCVTNTTLCTWNDLHCGEEYTVVVRAKDDNCTSVPSNSSVIHMDPCVPKNLVASADCNMKVVSLSWDASNGTKLYMVSAEGGHNTTGLTTNVTTANFSDLMCGQNYSLTVTPHNSQCPGNSSAPASIQTWPCPPSGISTTQNCLSGNIMVTWQAGNGSDFYTVTMETDSGLLETSTSNSNQKSFPGLTCGHNFSVSVTASNPQCNTTSSETTSLQSVPCVPTNISVVMECANNTALVSWAASRGALQYSVRAHSSHSNVSCQTSDLSCSLGNLTCGSSYTVQVAAMDDSCSSVPSQAVVLNSAPCPPQNVSAHFNCSSNDMMISWDATREADHFLVSVVTDNGGINESCNTTNTACSLSNVTCGKTFTIHVTSVRGDCSSRHSQNHTILSAPCPPQGIRGNLDCVTNSAWISWDAAAGADYYTVSAVGGGNHTANCSTSSNTTCEVEDLECGVLYNFRVTAKNSQCESPPGDTIDLQTAACSLSAITAVSQCHNSSILVMWTLMEGGAGDTVYTATAEASDHSRLYCNDTGTSCYLHGAQCDLRYTIIVAASSDQCSSMRSPPYRISTEPCPPRNVTVDSSCEEHRALVSWTRSPVAETYSVVAMAADGHVHTCNTTSNNCSVSDLHCDEQYTVFVTAHHENCSSRASQNTTVNRGPCQPDGVSVTFNCNNQSAVLSWAPRDNAVEYYGCAQSANGEMLYCYSTDGNCTIEGLECGTVYNFSVQASDGTCNSSFSDPVHRGATPCPPDIVEVQLLPMQMEVQVIRVSWTQISCRDPEYMLALTGSLLGDSQALFELSSYWTNSTYFEIPLPCGSSYEATVQSRNSAGTSNASVALSGTTAPCPPSAVVYSGNSTFASISWNASVYATAYTLYDNSSTPWTQLCRVVGQSCSLSNITSSSLVITASNAAGESEAELITNVIPHVRRRRHLLEVQDGDLSAPVLHVTQIAPTVVLVEWETVDDTSQYSLVRRKQDSSSPPEELIVYGGMILVTELSPNSNYCFTVSASSSVTSGPESEPVCVQTGSELSQ
nr:PREDICTED: fibronectin-like [Paralichthys olivaceus]